MNSSGVVGTLTGQSWKRCGVVRLLIEPYNSLDAWWREHAAGLVYDSGSLNGLRRVEFQGEVGCDDQGLYASQNGQRVDLGDVVGRLLRILVDDRLVFTHARY